MDEDDYSINVSCVVSDYLNHRIQRAGYNWQTSPTRNCPNNKVITVLRALCGEFEKRYEKQFAEIFSTCDQFELNLDSYNAVLDNLIEDGLHWGRVIGVFTFAGAMAVQCMDNGREQFVDMIREWTCSFILKNVQSWMNKNNGWKGLVDFYNNGIAEKDREMKQDKQQQNGWGTMFLGAIRVVAMGAHIVNRA